MKRQFLSSFALLALTAVVACKGRSAEPIKLVPDQATMIAGVDIQGLTSSKLYADNKDQILSDEEAKEALEAAKSCNAGPDSLKTMTIGLDPTSQNHVIVIAGTGIGKEATLTCIHDKVKEKRGEAPWTLEEVDGKKVLKMKEGESIGHIVSDDILAITSTGWSAAVKELMAGKGKPAIDNSLKALYGRAQKDKDIWFAGNLPTQASESLKGTPGENVKDFTGSLEFSEGLAVALAAGTGSAENAKKLQDEIQMQFDQFKGVLGPLGVPQAAVDSVKFGTTTDAVTVEAKLSNDEIKTLQEKLQGMMGGMMGGPGMGAPPPGMGGMGDPGELGDAGMGDPGAVDPAGIAVDPAGVPPAGDAAAAAPAGDPAGAAPAGAAPAGDPAAAPVPAPPAGAPTPAPAAPQ